MKCICLFVLFVYAIQVNAQTERYQKRVFYYGTDSMPYRILIPDDFNPKKKYPLVIFLHGSGERGSDNERQLIHGKKLFLSDTVSKQFPSIVVFPQCASSSYWSNVITTGTNTRSFDANRAPTAAMVMLIALIDDLIKTQPVNKKQLYVGGLSMGGMGTFEIVHRKPKLFAAAFPICGGGDLKAARKMTRPSWWIFHGDKDDTVLPIHSIEMADALKKAGARVRFTLYPGVNHGSWHNAFAEPELLPWLFSQHN